MSRGRCTLEQRAACPLIRQECFSDTHHLAYESGRYKTRVERRWRDLDFNKIDICRALHNAIHASGYVPEKPDRETMLHETFMAQTPYRALEERMTQLAIGQAVLQSPEDAA